MLGSADRSTGPTFISKILRNIRHILHVNHPRGRFQLGSSKKIGYLKEYRCEVAASVFAFYPISESSDGPLSVLPSILHHQMSYCYPTHRLRTGDSLMVADINGR
ncbi:hypothetical protein EVAR_70959_1 [Eumeta japonica]|uniref:Uncharacterized protein n=1 Tax=Eumeta variegata TaxID=151549 RepID=A0A4C1SJ38_EUMVA|nr:hypothetical protein EVAR_70959_1 [Eumeta japonica]